MMEFIARLKLATEGLVNHVLSSPSTTFLFTAGIFLLSILFFFLTYWFLYTFHQVSLVRFNDQNVIGANIPLPAFQASDSFRRRIEVKVKNDLRLREFVDETTNVSWQSLSQDDLMSRQFPSEGNIWREFRERNVLGTSPTEMVEIVFKKYGPLKYRITTHRENSFDTIFPLKVMSEYFRVSSIEALHERIRLHTLSQLEQVLYDRLRISAPLIRSNVFQQDKASKLFFLSELLVNQATTISKEFEDQDRLKNIIYGEVLSILAPPQTLIEFDFDSLPTNPELMDFLYLSTTIATSNIPGEIVPITNDVRTVIWIQLMLSYFILALNVAALLKWLKI